MSNNPTVLYIDDHNKLLLSLDTFNPIYLCHLSSCFSWALENIFMLFFQEIYILFFINEHKHAVFIFLLLKFCFYF